MNFNYQKLLKLFRESGEKKVDFAHAVFGPTSRLGPEYFADKEKNITIQHLDVLAKHFHVHWTYFIDDAEYGPKNSYNNVGKVIATNDVATLNIHETGEMSKETLQILLSTMEKIIADKNDEIKWIKAQWDNVLSAVKTLSK